MIAQVLVDLPLFQTDKPFDYQIPEPWESLIEPGMRVTVPFGNRKLMGLVYHVQDTSEVNQLKAIDTLIDYTPVLNKEMMQLGEWLAGQTLCYLYTAYQTLLPAAMKANYKKVVSVQDHERLQIFHPEIAKVINGREQIAVADLEKQMADGQPSIHSAIKDGVLSEGLKITEKGSVKKQKVIQLTVDLQHIPEIIPQLNQNAKKQQLVLKFFYDNNTDHLLTSALITQTGVGRSVLRTLIDKGWLTEFEQEVYRDPYDDKSVKPTEPLSLTAEQADVFQAVYKDIIANEHHVHLCHGVTGSGKTEIYLQMIQEVLQRGKTAIVLVPEISLTPQMVERFKSRFGSDVAVMHSGLSKGEKYDEWRKIYRHEVNVVVGARSAVFAPFDNLGAIIIDEEHETSYKQEENPRYHAKDVAIVRGQYHECPVVLGSATPSLESYARGQKGNYQLSTLARRVNNQTMPEVAIVDMREELRNGNHSMFSKQLFDQLQANLEKGEQSVLFLNRRGYSTFVMCRDCGYVVECPHCDISLTFHRKYNQLKCHYCGYDQSMPETCPECDSEYIRYFGSGTQKVEEALNQLLPEARVIRMDVDTTGRKGAHEKLLNRFGSGEADILLGTQMIAKGLDFPKVTLVGVLAADAMLNLPDFRASEKTYQLLTQVGGRAGRHELKGQVVIQSYNPEHYAIQMAAEHDFFSFYQKEMAVRRQHQYSPYYFLSLITVTHSELTTVVTITENIAKHLRETLSARSMILGPVAPPIARIKDKFRYHVMIKYKYEPGLHETLKKLLNHYQDQIAKGTLSIAIDMNPYMLM